MSVVWETPEVLVQQSKKTKLEEVVEKLVGRPGEWGRIGTAKNYKAAYTRSFKTRNDLRKLELGRFELTARKLNNNQGAIYARFLGDLVDLPEEAYRDVGFTITT